MVEFLTDAAKGAQRATLVLAHGAGAPMDSAFMSAIAKATALHGVRVLRFEFAYMAARRLGTRKLPPRMPVLMGEYEAALSEAARSANGAPLLIGGKSMGGRVASMIADTASSHSAILGCVCLGYPFHPAGKPETKRTAHLIELNCPTLIIQGERDALGDRREVDGLQLSKAIEIAWIKDGDHDLKPRAKSGSTHAEAIENAAVAIARFVDGVSKSRRRRSRRKTADRGDLGS